jgi:hypothetical protein
MIALKLIGTCVMSMSMVKPAIVHINLPHMSVAAINHPNGAAGGSTYDEIEKIRSVQWMYLRTDDHTTEVDAWDILRGHNGAFTGISANGSMINPQNIYKWRETSHSGSYSSSGATSTVVGDVTDFTTGEVVVTLHEPDHNFYYLDVFPN